MDQSENEISEFQQCQEILILYFPDIVLLKHKRDPHNIEEFAIYEGRDCKFAICYHQQIGSTDIFIGPSWNANTINCENIKFYSTDYKIGDHAPKFEWYLIGIFVCFNTEDASVRGSYQENLNRKVQAFYNGFEKFRSEMYEMESFEEKNYLKHKSPMQRGLFQMGKMIRKAWAAL